MDTAQSATPKDQAAAVWLLANSGLTRDQLGRALGVTRRSFGSWAAGTAVPARYTERLHELHGLVAGLEADAPGPRRSLLLDTRQGRSIFSRFLASTPRNQRIIFPVPVLERLGA